MSSWEALAWAKKQTVGNSLRKFILVLLCEKTDELFSCFPGRKKLASEAECSPSMIVEHQRALEKAGLITIVEQFRANGSQTTNRIYINHPNAPHVQGISEVEPSGGFI